VKRQGAGMSICRLLGLCGYGDPVGGYPEDFLWVWDGCGDRNSVPTAALYVSTLSMNLEIKPQKSCMQ